MLLDRWSRPLMQIEQTGLVSNLAPVHAGALASADARSFMSKAIRRISSYSDSCVGGGRVI
jgi:hypothetical protein